MTSRRHVFLAAAVAALLSGAAALVHQILWVRRLGDLVGHGGPAVAVVLATFFVGLGVGARLFGREADRTRHPARLYLILEVCIALWAVSFLGLADLVADLWLGLGPASWPLTARLLGSALLAALLILPPCLCLGGTLPVLVRIVTARAAATDRAAGHAVSWIYAVNTLGAATGALLAGFVVLPGLGIADGLLVAAAANLVAGLLIALLRIEDVHLVPGTSRTASDEDVRPVPGAIRTTSRRTVLAAAWVSGLFGIGCEIVWTRALAARLSSTVYSFAILLGSYLLALGLGAAVIAFVDRRRPLGRGAVGGLFLAAAVTAIASSKILVELGASLRRAAGNDLGRVQASELLTALLVMLPPCLVLGALFPSLVRLAHRSAPGGGLATDYGHIQLANTWGAVVAAALCGFVMLPLLGLTPTLLLLAGAAAAMGFVLLPSPVTGRFRGPRLHLAALAVLGLAAATLTTDLRSWRSRPGDVLVDYREGRSASVAVIRKADGDLILQVDQTYRLGGERGRFPQARQGLIPPLLGLGDARSAASGITVLPRSRFRGLTIGVGTGSSAGNMAALLAVRDRSFALDAVDVVPEVLQVLSRFDSVSESFSDRVAYDPRVSTHAIDARLFVASAAPESYAFVEGDLFVPWRPGEGAMYTLEHFDNVRRALSPLGIYVQWIPLYQLGPDELRTITKTFLEVFDHAAAIWLYYNTRTPTLGLVGTKDELRIPPRPLVTAFWELPESTSLLLAAGLDAPRELAGLWLCDRATLADFAGDAPIETLARPRTEYASARHQSADPRSLARDNLQALLDLPSDPLAQGYLEFVRDPAFRTACLARHTAARAVLHAGFAREHTQDPDAAVRHMLDAVAADPAWDWALRRFERDVREAIERSREALVTATLDRLATVPGAEAAFHALRARLAEHRGDRTTALAEAAKALALRPDDPATRSLQIRLERR